MLEVVVKRLKTLGYVSVPEEEDAVQYAVDQAEQWIINNINQRPIPDGLRFIWIDMACGLFLANLKATGQLTSIELAAPVKTISEGDTSVTFALEANGSPEARFEALLNSLVNPPEHQLAAYRRVKW